MLTYKQVRDLYYPFRCVFVDVLGEPDVPSMWISLAGKYEVKDYINDLFYKDKLLPDNTILHVLAFNRGNDCPIKYLPAKAWPTQATLDYICNDNNPSKDLLLHGEFWRYADWHTSSRQDEYYGILSPGINAYQDLFLDYRSCCERCHKLNTSEENYIRTKDAYRFTNSKDIDVLQKSFDIYKEIVSQYRRILHAN